VKFLVTGGAGFIGSHLCEALINQNNKVIVVDDFSTGFVSNLIKDDKLRLIMDKIQNVPNEVFSDINGIFHLAAQASVPVSIQEFYSSSLNNLQSALRVFDIAKEINIPVVYASSSAIYGNLPLGDDSTDNIDILSPYALDKLTLEKYAKLCFDLYKVSSIGCRFFNVYGPRQDPSNPYSGVISLFIDCFRSKKAVKINGGYQTRDFIYVYDIANCLIKAMNIANSASLCEVINMGTGKSITIDELFETLVRLFNYRPEVIYQPLPIGDPERSSGSYNKFKRLLNVELDNFCGFESGLKNIIDYLNLNVNETI
jgi:UDP-glucose 4-epimerase